MTLAELNTRNQQLDKKIASIKKEITVETAMLDGLEKLGDAKKRGGFFTNRVKTRSDIEMMDSQYEASQKKLTVLKSEITKVEAQKETVAKAIQEVASETSEKMVKIKNY
jgi:hypothetical protein